MRRLSYHRPTYQRVSDRCMWLSMIACTAMCMVSLFALDASINPNNDDNDGSPQLSLSWRGLNDNINNNNRSRMAAAANINYIRSFQNIISIQNIGGSFRRGGVHTMPLQDAAAAILNPRRHFPFPAFVTKATRNPRTTKTTKTPKISKTARSSKSRKSRKSTNSSKPSRSPRPSVMATARLLRPADPPSINSSRYVVFDASTFKGCLGFLDNAPSGWTVVLVNVHRAQLGSCRKCHVLTKAWASSFLGAARVKHVEGRVVLKMAAYLYLLTFDPEWIYTTDQPVDVPYLALERVAVGKTSARLRPGLVYRGASDLFNPCSHFMDPAVWNTSLENAPRGPNLYSLRPVPTHSVYQVVSGCVPPGLKLKGKNWKTLLDRRAPIAYVMAGAFAVVDFNNVLVPRDAAWILVTSLVRRFTRSKYLLGLVAQRALWETGVTVGFVPSAPVRKTCTHCFLASILKAKTNDLRKKMVNLECAPTALTALKSIAPPTMKVNEPPTSKVNAPPTLNLNAPPTLKMNAMTALNVTGCLLQFHRLTEPEEGPPSIMLSVLEHWISFLRDFVLHFPKSKTASRSQSRTGSNALTKQTLKAKLEERFKGNPVYTTPLKTYVTSLKKNKTMTSSLPSNTSNPNPFTQVCSSDGHEYRPFVPSRPAPFRTTLLIIVINKPESISQISWIEYIYGRYFSHIVFCSRSIDHFTQAYKERVNRKPVTFVSMSNVFDTQNCASAVIRMDFNVSGYFFVEDDSFVNLWALHKLPYDQPWFPGNIRLGDVTQPYHHSHQSSGQATSSPGHHHHQSSMLSAWKGLQRLVTSRNHAVRKRGRSFLQNLLDNTGCRNCFLFSESDVFAFYIPASIAEDFRFFTDYFRRFQVPYRVAVMATIGGLVPRAAIHPLSRQSVCHARHPKAGLSIGDFHQACTASRLGDHPNTLANATNITIRAESDRRCKFFCRHILQRLDKGLLSRTMAATKIKNLLH